MKKRFLRKYSLLLVLLGGISSGTFAQTDDFTTWTSMKVNYRILPDFTIGAKAEMRTKDSMKEIDRWGMGLNAAYAINTYLKAEGGYELHYRNRGDEGWKFRHRYSIGVTGSVGWNRFKFSLRERFQQTFFEGEAENRLRSRLKIAYDLPKSIVSPYVSAELYQPLGDDDFWEVARMRYRPGVELKLSRNWTLDVFYCYQYQPDKKKHILGVEGSFSF